MRQKAGVRTLKDIIIMVAIVVFILVGGIVLAGASLTQSERFLAGSSINGIDISNLTPEEAEKKVLREESAKLQPVSLKVECDGQVLELTDRLVGKHDDIKQLTEQSLYKITGGDSAAKMDALLSFSKGASVEYKVDYDKEIIKDTLNRFGEKFKIEAKDASFTVREDGISLNYTEEVAGKYLDIEEATVLVYDRLKSSDMKDLHLQFKTLAPKQTLSDLQQNVSLIGSYTTKVSESDSNRNANIDLIAATVNGTKLEPNDVLSLNEITGELEEADGYKLAPSIINEEEKNVYGGGSCQLASTLYVAALNADMEVVERNRHSWAPGYITTGLDAMIDYATNKDLVLKNVSTQPVYIFAKRQGEDVKVQIYGKLANPEYQIVIEPQLLGETMAGEDIQIYDPSMSPGSKRLVKQGHTGIKVRVERHYKRDGQTVDKQLISSDNYPPIQAVYHTGDNAISK